MFFGEKASKEPNFGLKEPSSGFSVSPLVAVVFLSVACGCMLGAYFLGFRAGHTNGLELALANNLAQVVRSPVARVSDDNIEERPDSSDVYAKLKEPTSIREPNQEKQLDVSKEVKDFLAPTATPSSKLNSSQKNSGTQIVEVPPSAFQEKKQADTAAIERALNEAKTQEELGKKSEIEPNESQLAANSFSAKPELDTAAVRVIGGGRDSTEIKNSAEVKSEQFESVEDFSEPPLKAKSKESPKEKTVVDTKNVDSGKLVADKVIKDNKKEVALDKSRELPKAQESAKAQPLPKGWYSQVAAPRSIAEAQSISNKLRGAGFKSRIETAEVRDQKYYRVVVGPELSRTSADQVLLRLKNQNIVRTEPFIRMVK